MVVVLDSIAAARPALSDAVVLRARNADRAADARRALPKAEAVVVGDVETSGTARPPHRNLRRDFRRAAAGLSWPTVRTSHVVIDGDTDLTQFRWDRAWHCFDGGTAPEMALIERRVRSFKLWARPNFRSSARAACLSTSFDRGYSEAARTTPLRVFN